MRRTKNWATVITKMLARRAGQSTLGREVVARHWFVSRGGPWSDEQKQAAAAMRRQLQLPSE